MFNGGTSFGWMNGANSDGTSYSPYVTSYDYGAPLNEAGQITPRYRVFRQAISEATGKVASALPLANATIQIAEFSALRAASLWTALPNETASGLPVPMEEWNQAYGYALYRTTISKPTRGELSLPSFNDHATIYLNGKFVGTLDRRLNQKPLRMNVTNADAQLDVLIGNTGRAYFTRATQGENKGLSGPAYFDGRALTQWSMYGLSMENVEQLDFSENT